MHVEVIYALPRSQRIVELELPVESSVMDAIEASGLMEEFKLPWDDTEARHVGIFGRKVSLETCLNEGDRVEIYRPLHMSPAEARRLRARTLAEKGNKAPPATA